MSPCPQCGGEGHEVGGGQPCPDCNGSGEVPCEVHITNHVDKHTPAHIVNLCWGATCEEHGDLLNGDWFDYDTVQQAVNAHKGES